MPSRDDRPPSFCSERMRICQQHLSKVYGRSKKLLVAARAGKVVPEVTGSAARGYTGEGTSKSGHVSCLSKFEQKKLSPYLCAVAGLFVGPSLLKQFQLKKLRAALADKNFRKHSQPDCPGSCIGGTCDPVTGQPLITDLRPNTALISEDSTNLDPFPKPREVRQGRTSPGVVSQGQGIKVAVSSDVRRDDFTPETRELLDRHHNSSASSELTVSMEEEAPGKQVDSPRLLQGRNGSNSLFASDEPGRWSYPPYLCSSDQMAACTLGAPPSSSFPSYQKVRGRSSMYRMDDMCINNRPFVVPTEAYQLDVPTSSVQDPTQHLRITDQPHRASSTNYNRNPYPLNVESQQRASSIEYDGDHHQLLADAPQRAYSTKNDSYQRQGSLSTDRKSTQLMADPLQRVYSTKNDSYQRQGSLSTDRKSTQLMADPLQKVYSTKNDSYQRQGSLSTGRKSTQLMADPLQRAYSTMDDSYQRQVSLSTDRKSTQLMPDMEPQQRAPSLSNDRKSMQLMADMESQNRAISLSEDRKPLRLMADMEPQQRAISLSENRKPLQLMADMESQQRAISLSQDRKSLQLMADMESQKRAISLAEDRKSLQLIADMESQLRALSQSNGFNQQPQRASGVRDPSQVYHGSDMPPEVATVSGRSHRQSSSGMDSRHRKSSRRSSRRSTQGLSPGDAQPAEAPTNFGRTPPETLAIGDSQQRALFMKNGRHLSQRPPSVAVNDSQQRALSMKNDRHSFQRPPSAHAQQKSIAVTNGRNASHYAPSAIDPQQARAYPSSWKLPRVSPVADYLQPAAEAATSGFSHLTAGDSEHHRAAGTTESERKTFSDMLPSDDARQRQKGGFGDGEPGSFASRLNKRVSNNSRNVLQASVANYIGAPANKSKALHTLSVSQLHDAICDHSTPDCPSFKKPGSSPEVSTSAVPRPLQHLKEQGPPQADALGSGAAGAAEQTTDPETGDGLEPSRHEIVSANEKCTQYAFEVRADMRRQEKSSASLWKYGSMAVCTENPGRDYTTGESPPNAWEILAKKKVEISGIHWSKSGSRKVVSHVCQILRQNKWGKGAIERLNAVKGIVHPHCVNAVLQQQTDANLCLNFFNWAKRQKGYRHDVFAFTTMINILGRARNLKGVRRLLEDMREGGVEPNVATYNTLILCYGKVDSLNESLRVFRIMQEAGCKPDNVTYSILIHLCIKAGYLQEALKLYQNMREAGVQPDTISYSIVIDTIGRTGNLGEARKLFGEMKERGYVPNEFTYNSMIDRHAKARKTQHALKYYTEMRAAGFKLNKVTCTIMMGVLSTLGKYDEAEALFSELQQMGIVADTAVYSLIINMWGNAGDLDKAVSWYGRMLGNLVTPSLTIFSALINAHLEANLYEAAQHFLTSMGMWGINSDLKLYTILLRHCTICEKQEHADAVLGIMDRLGHPAHRFLYELLTAKNQDRASVRARVSSYLETVEQEEQNNLQGFLNALIEFLHKLQCKTDPGYVWEIASERDIFPSSIVRREAPNHWLVDLHSLSVGTALVALPRLLATLRDSWTKNPTKRVYIVTGWGKRSRVTGTSALKQAVSEVLDGTRSPFAPDHANAGVFVSYGPPFCDWISQPSIMKKLVGLTAKAGL